MGAWCCHEPARILNTENSRRLIPREQTGVKYLRAERRAKMGKSQKYVPVPPSELAPVPWSLTTGDKIGIPSFEYVEGPYTFAYYLVKVDVKALRPGEPAIRSFFIWGEEHSREITGTNELESPNTHTILEWIQALLANKTNVYWDMFLEYDLFEQPMTQDELEHRYNSGSRWLSAIGKEFHDCFYLEKTKCRLNDRMRFHNVDFRNRQLPEPRIRELPAFHEFMSPREPPSPKYNPVSPVSEPSSPLAVHEPLSPKEQDDEKIKPRGIDPLRLTLQVNLFLSITRFTNIRARDIKDIPEYVISKADWKSSDTLWTKAKYVLPRLARDIFTVDTVHEMISTRFGMSLAQTQIHFPDYVKMVQDYVFHLVDNPFSTFAEHEVITRRRRFQQQEVHPLIQADIDHFIIGMFHEQQAQFKHMISSLKTSWLEFRKISKTLIHTWTRLLNLISITMTNMFVRVYSSHMDEYMFRRAFRRFHLPEHERDQPHLQFCSNIIYTAGASHTNQLALFLNNSRSITVLDRYLVSGRDVDIAVGDAMERAASNRHHNVHLFRFPREFQVVQYRDKPVKKVEPELTLIPVDWWFEPKSIVLCDCMALTVFRVGTNLVYLWSMIRNPNESKIMADSMVDESKTVADLDTQLKPADRPDTICRNTLEFLTDRHWPMAVRARLIEYQSTPSPIKNRTLVLTGTFGNVLDLKNLHKPNRKRARESNPTLDELVDRVWTEVSDTVSRQFFHLMLDQELALLVWRTFLTRDPDRTRMMRAFPLSKTDRWLGPHYLEDTHPRPLTLVPPEVRDGFTMPFLNG